MEKMECGCGGSSLQGIFPQTQAFRPLRKPRNTCSLNVLPQGAAKKEPPPPTPSSAARALQELFRLDWTSATKLGKG